MTFGVWKFCISPTPRGHKCFKDIAHFLLVFRSAHPHVRVFVRVRIRLYVLMSMFKSMAMYCKPTEAYTRLITASCEAGTGTRHMCSSEICRRSSQILESAARCIFQNSIFGFLECNLYIDCKLSAVGEVPTKRSSDHDPMIRHCRIIGLFNIRSKIVGLSL